MKNKSLLLLFIFSFLCVIFTFNSLCFRYIDNRVDTVLLTIKYRTNNIQKIKNDLTTKNVNILKENTRLIISMSIGVLFFFLFVYVPQFYTLLFLITFIIAYLIAYKLCLNQNIFISLASPVLALATANLFASTYDIKFKKNVDKKIENVLSKYISQDIKNKILKNETIDVGLGGKRAEISVMFADIRGFTSLSETRKAEEVSALLNEYFTELEPIIAKYNGVINKFIGDAVLVVFGDPTPDKFHAKNAVKCAEEMRQKVRQIREKWICEGKPKIDIGIGINTGEAFIGNVGSSNRFEYTVIGDTVNIASRIEDYNKIYKTQILISENTYNKISQIVDVIKIREVAIKGKRKKINIYEVLRITE